MTKTVIKTLVTTLCVSFMLSSCLGDSNNKLENHNALAYIQKGDYRNVAVTTAIPFTNDYVDKLYYGEFYYLDFVVHTQDGQNSDGSYIARSVGPVGNGEPIVRSEDLDVRTEKPQTGVVDVYPTQMNVSIFSSYKSDLDDNWVFSYEGLVYKEDKELDDVTKKDNIRVVATLLAEDQFSGAGETLKPLGEGKAIIRLYLIRYDNSRPVDKTKDKVSYKGEASIRLSSLRSYFKATMPTIATEGSLAIIQFKYLVQKNKEGETELKYIGNLNEENPDFRMVITKD